MPVENGADQGPVFFVPLMENGSRSPSISIEEQAARYAAAGLRHATQERDR